MSTQPPTPADPAALPLDIISSGPHEGIAVLRLQQPGSPMVVLDHPLIRAIEAALLALPGTIRGFVLASNSPRVFIAGADLKTIESPSSPASQGWSDDQLERYLAYGQRVFAMIAHLPVPTAAAINGAALGGGLEIAMHCDALIGAPSPAAKPYPIGLPEAGLCICPGWGGTNLLPARIDPVDALRRTAEGRPMNSDEASAAGLFDRFAPSPEALLPTALDWVAEQNGRVPVSAGRRDGAPSRWIGRPDRAPAVMAALPEVREQLRSSPAGLTPHAGACLAAVEAGLEKGWDAALETERLELTRLRNTDPAKAAIRAFFEKSAKK